MMARIQNCKAALMARTWARGVWLSQLSCGAKDIARQYCRKKKQSCLRLAANVLVEDVEWMVSGRRERLGGGVA